MDTEKGKSVVSLRGGTLAVYLNTGAEISQARIIGRNLKPAWQVYIILNNNGQKEYVSIGQADKKVIGFNTKKINGGGEKEICGAAVGLYGRREFYEGFVEGFKEKPQGIKEAKNNSNSKIYESPSIPLVNKTEVEKPSDEKLMTKANKTEHKSAESSVLSAADTVTETEKNNEFIESAGQTEKATDTQFEKVDDSAIYKEYTALKEETRAHDTFKKVVENFKTQMNELEKAGVITPEEMAKITGNTEENSLKTNNDAVNNTCNTENNEKTEKAEKAETEKSEQNEQNEKIIPKSENTDKTEENNDESNEKSEKTDKYGIDYLFSHNEKLYPFKESPYDWVRVCMDEIWLLPVDKHEILNPFVMLSDLKYSHLMLGRSIDKKVIVLAVPEKFRREDIKSAASFGFKDFWRCNEQQSRGVFGYWIKKLI